MSEDFLITVVSFTFLIILFNGFDLKDKVIDENVITGICLLEKYFVKQICWKTCKSFSLSLNPFCSSKKTFDIEVRKVEKKKKSET